VQAEDGTGLSRRDAWLTLVAMTLAASMILVDQTSVPLAAADVVAGVGAPLGDGQWVLTANILPLAAFLVLGGRLGDMYGLRRVFLTGAVVFIASSALAGAAMNFWFLVTMRVTQGMGAALMMPTSIAIVSAVFPRGERGRVLGYLAGASAFFAALGPLIGGLLTEYVDWRAVFLVNVPLAAAAIVLTLWTTPALGAEPGEDRSLDWAGIVLFALGTVAFVLGLSQGRPWGWTSAGTVGALALAAVALAAFAVVELRSANPLIRFGLFRHLNFAAANISQFVAGMVELGLGMVMPLYLIRILELDPAQAGVALLAASLPVIVVGPLAGRAFDAYGGRIPLVAGFLALTASSLWLAGFVERGEYLILVPGLVLQGIGLGTILTVNDPTGINSVPRNDRGQAAGVINTTEQLGGAVGIAALVVVLFTTYFNDINRVIEAAGIRATPEDFERFRAFIEKVEQVGIANVSVPPDIRRELPLASAAFADAFQATMLAAAAVCLVGAVASFVLVRQTDRVAGVPTGMRRSRWYWMGR
jgi:EmrB/QacA subfamily drug resistance transporter